MNASTAPVQANVNDHFQEEIMNHWTQKSAFITVLLASISRVALAGYANGNPLSYVDPEGLDAVVITGGVREHRNPFGHSAIGITGAGIFSYGNNTPLGGSPLSYLESQSKFRDQQVTFIPRTPAQDQDALKNLSENSCRNCVGLLDNCAAKTDSALRAAGVRTNMSPFPGGVARDAARATGATTYYIPQNGPIPQELLDALKRFNAPNVP